MCRHVNFSLSPHSLTQESMFLPFLTTSIKTTPVPRWKSTLRGWRSVMGSVIQNWCVTEEVSLNSNHVILIYEFPEGPDFHLVLIFLLLDLKCNIDFLSVADARWLWWVLVPDGHDRWIPEGVCCKADGLRGWAHPTAEVGGGLQGESRSLVLQCRNTKWNSLCVSVSASSLSEIIKGMC